MDKRRILKDYIVRCVINNVNYLILFIVCLISVGCNIPKAEITLLKEKSGLVFPPNQVKIYENFEQITGHYEILGKVSAGILPQPCSTSAKRTKVLLEKAGQIGANGVVGPYDKEEFYCTACHPRTTGIAVLVTDKPTETKRDRPAFIIKVPPVIWKDESAKGKNLKKIEEAMIAQMHCIMRNKGYYAKPINKPTGLSPSDLEQLSREQLESLFGKETDYVLIIEILSEDKMFLGLGESSSAHLKISLFSIRNQEVTWFDDSQKWTWTGVLWSLTGGGHCKGAWMVKKELKRIPVSGLK